MQREREKFETERGREKQLKRCREGQRKREGERQTMKEKQMERKRGRVCIRERQ
jgi:hypothetical protein